MKCKQDNTIKPRALTKNECIQEVKNKKYDQGNKTTKAIMELHVFFLSIKFSLYTK